MTEFKLVNGVMMPEEPKPPKPEKPLPAGKQYTEVRVRHFYKNDDNGMIVMPTVVYFFEDGKAEADMEVGAISVKLMKDISEQLPFPVRCMTTEEIAEEIAKEISVGSLQASQGKAALSVFAKNLKDESVGDKTEAPKTPSPEGTP